MAYTTLSADESRKILNMFGVIPGSTMMKLRNRTMKMILLDCVTHLIEEEKLPYAEVTAKLEKVINDGIEQGFCTPSMVEVVARFINKSYQKVDPRLRLDCATTMEILTELGGKGNTDVTVLPEKVVEAAECGPECLGGERPSMENLVRNVTPCAASLFATVGGSFNNSMKQALSETLPASYLERR